MRADAGIGFLLGMMLLVLLCMAGGAIYLGALQVGWIGTQISYDYLGEINDFEVSSTKCKVELTNGEKHVVNGVCYDLVTGKKLYWKERAGWFGDTYEKYEVI